MKMERHFSYGKLLYDDEDQTWPDQLPNHEEITHGSTDS